MKKIIKIMNAKDLPLKTQLENSIFDGLVEVEFTRNSPLKLTSVSKLDKRPSRMIFEIFSDLR